MLRYYQAWVGDQSIEIGGEINRPFALIWKLDENGHFLNSLF